MDYLKDLESIVNINSYTKNKTGVDLVGQKMASWLKLLKFEVFTYKREDIGNHLLFSSKKKSGKKILLLGHNDTVFPPNSFEGFSEDETWVYGPGVCDMKGGNIVALQSLRNIFEKNNEIFNIDFLLVSDEETGSDDSKELTSSIARDYDYCFVLYSICPTKGSPPPCPSKKQKPVFPLSATPITSSSWPLPLRQSPKPRRRWAFSPA